MSEAVAKVSISRELTREEIAEIEQAVRNEFPDAESVTLTPLQSMGLTGAELFLSVAISFGTSIAANAAYDYGKSLIRQLRRRGVDAEQVDEE